MRNRKRACLLALSAIVLTACTIRPTIHGLPLEPTPADSASALTNRFARSFPPGVHFLSHHLERVYSYLRSASPSFRAKMDQVIERQDFTIIVGYPHDFPAGTIALPMSGGIAHIEPLTSDDDPTRLWGALVVFETSHLESAALQRGYPMPRLIQDLSTILAHELYGHLVPIIESPNRRWPGPCGDIEEASGMPSCAVVKENLIRAELGLPPRQRASDLSPLGFIATSATHP